MLRAAHSLSKDRVAGHGRPGLTSNIKTGVTPVACEFEVEVDLFLLRSQQAAGF